MRGGEVTEKGRRPYRVADKREGLASLQPREKGLICSCVSNLITKKSIKHGYILYPTLLLQDTGIREYPQRIVPISSIGTGYATKMKYRCFRIRRGMDSAHG